MTPYETYQKFLAFKMHFTTNYNYVKYQGKVRANPKSFDMRPDKYQFLKLSKHKDVEHFIIANFVDNKVQWVGDLVSDKADACYDEWIKRQQSLTYNFTSDLNKLLTLFDKNLIVENGQHPPLLKLYMRKEISIETLIILNDIVGFFPHWNKKIDDSFLWPSVYTKCLKYKPFLHYDMQKYKTILKNKFAGDE